MKEAHRLLRDRTDPHGYPIKSEDILKSIVITDEGGKSESKAQDATLPLLSL